MVGTIQGEKNNFKYQETMNVDVESIASKNEKIGYQYTKLLITNILKQQNYSGKCFRPMQR